MLRRHSRGVRGHGLALRASIAPKEGKNTVAGSPVWLSQAACRGFDADSMSGGRFEGTCGVKTVLGVFLSTSRSF